MCLPRWGGLFPPRDSRDSNCYAHTFFLRAEGDRPDVLRQVASSLGPLRKRDSVGSSSEPSSRSLKVPDATDQVAVYRALGSAKATWERDVMPE